MASDFHNFDLSEAILSEAFPFHIVIDKCGIVLSYGDALARNLESFDKQQRSIFDDFIFQHPAGVHDVSDLASLKDKLFLLEYRNRKELVLRGQLVVGKDQSCFVFLVSPWVADVGVLDGLGLTLNDFPVHSPMSDFLILVQAQRVSLEDSQRLSNELAGLNKELEDRVLRRTHALECQANELLESKMILEHEMKERERVEVELRHAQKLESVGQLAAGIAHEINTPMQYVGSSLCFLEESYKDLNQFNGILKKYISEASDSDSASIIDLQLALDEVDFDFVCERGSRALKRSIDGIDRVTEIVKAMNEFTHPDEREKSYADINRALSTVLTVANNEYKYCASVETDLQEIPLLNCYLGDLNQVFLNLIVNASHAIEKKEMKCGLIKIVTRQTNDSIVVSISDNGIGIPKDIQHRIFDPFFTTKEVGKGTGQGLSISHRIIVENHGGRLHFESIVGEGTTFYIELPIHTNSSEENLPDMNFGRGLAA